MKQEKHSFTTKKALASALKETMKHKPFNKITVSELIQLCNINRKTFYYHFDDIYHLLQWLFEQEAIEILRQFDLIVDYEEAITFMIHYINVNEEMLNCAYDSIGPTALKNFFYDDFYAIVVSIIEYEENMNHHHLTSDYKDFLTHLYTQGIVATWCDLIKNKQKRKTKQFAHYLSMTIKHSLLGILSTNEIEFPTIYPPDD